MGDVISETERHLPGGKVLLQKPNNCGSSFCVDDAVSEQQANDKTLS